MISFIIDITATIGEKHTLLDYIPCSYSNGAVVCDKIPLEKVLKVFS